MRITICRRRQVGFLFFVFAARQQVPPLKKQQSNRHHPEAVVVSFQKLVAVGFRKLVAFRGWWHPDAGGIWRLVASRGWWHPEAGGGGNAATTMAGLTFFIFCNQKSVPLQFNLSQGELFPFFMK